MFDNLNEEKAQKMIPFKNNGFRPGQWKAIEEIVDAINCDNRYIILNAPVGLGKSVIGYILAKSLEEENRETYLYTKTKQLQDQYLKDFSDVKLVKGRSNFQCGVEPLMNCSNGMCQSHNNYKCDLKPMLKEDWMYNGTELPKYPVEIDGRDCFYGDFEFDEYYTSGMCEYWKQKIDGIMSPITMLNYNYAISDARFVNHFPLRSLGVFDEGHNIEQIIMNELEYSFAPSAIEKETQFVITQHTSIDKWIDDIDILIGIYKELKENASSETKKQKYQDRYVDFKTLNELLIDDPQNWVLTTENVRGVSFNIFKPIKVDKYTYLLFDSAQYSLIMSGTILKSDIFARDLGIDDFAYIEVPSIIPISNRPIYRTYVGSMSRANVDTTMPKMISAIKEIAYQHSDEKGLIHTFTYNIANRFKDAFGKNSRFIFHNQNDKERKFKMFKKDNTNKILVSPVAFEGVDFPYNEARWQCICKDPFPNIGDPQIKVRDMTDYGWLFRQRCLVLSQMYGRTNRAEDDYSVTYLLDSNLESIIGPSTLVTDYFLEALAGYHYNDKLIMAEDAYDRLTPDNKRKTHEVDRFQETAILDAIKDEGLDTTNSLRRAYKEMHNESYKLVIPTIERLIKNGAIKYEEN